MTSQQISATEPDWSREKLYRWWDPAPQLLRSLRGYQQWRDRGPVGRLISKYYSISHKFWSVIAAADVPLNCQIQGGLCLRHPNGVVIHPDAVIGPNCLILQQVTIVGGVVVGGHVDIGAGAKIVRSVTIGDHAKIGANAVVLCDVPAGATAVGIPARIILPKPTAAPEAVTELEISEAAAKDPLVLDAATEGEPVGMELSQAEVVRAQIAARKQWQPMTRR
jgi:serine O-acetyltransferase